MKARSKRKSFRVGRVGAYLRGEVWYLGYYEHGRRRRPRVGTDRNAARLAIDAADVHHAEGSTGC